MSHNCISQGCACSKGNLMEPECCLFCQVGIERKNDTGIRFLCGTYTGPAFFEGPFRRSEICKDRQIVNLEEQCQSLASHAVLDEQEKEILLDLLEQTKEILTYVAMNRNIHVPPHDPDNYYGDKAADLLPKIQTAIGREVMSNDPWDKFTLDNPEWGRDQLQDAQEEINRLKTADTAKDDKMPDFEAVKCEAQEKLAIAMELCHRARKSLVNFMEGTIVDDIELLEDIDNFISTNTMPGYVVVRAEDLEGQIAWAEEQLDANYCECEGYHFCGKTERRAEIKRLKDARDRASSTSAKISQEAETP